MTFIYSIVPTFMLQKSVIYLSLTGIFLNLSKGKGILRYNADVIFCTIISILLSDAYIFILQTVMKSCFA